MPAKTKKQQGYFKLVKAYKESGLKGFFEKWREVYGSRPYPDHTYVKKVAHVASKISEKDLDDLVSGVEGETQAIRPKKKIEVGDWVLFKGKYRDAQGNPKEGTFVSKVKNINHPLRIVNFNIYDFYNKYGDRIAPLRRLEVTHKEFPYLDFAYFGNVIKTGKNKRDVIEPREGSIAVEVFSGDERTYEFALNEKARERSTEQSWPEMLRQRERVLSKLGRNELEPQVKDAVETLNMHGYVTSSSGFVGSPNARLAKGVSYPVHTIDGILGLSDKQIEAVNKSGLGDVISLDDFIPGYQAIRVKGSNDLNEVKRRFDEIVKIILSLRNG